MFVNPVLFGSLVTIGVELVVLIVVGVYFNWRGKR